MACHVAACLDGLAAEGVEVYLFGSVLHGDPAPSDVDLLLLYSDPDAEKRARGALGRLWMGRPAHLISLTPDEAAHYDFIERTEAVRLWPRHGLGAIPGQRPGPPPSSPGR